MRRGLILLLLLALSAPAFGGTISCTAGMVSAGYCRSTSDTLIYLPILTAELQNIVPALAYSVGWTATIPCTDALVTAGTCTQQQLGQQVANPETQAQAAARALRTGIISTILAAQRRQVADAKDAEKAAAVAAVTMPNVGN